MSTPNLSDSSHSPSSTPSPSAECVVCSDSDRDTVLFPCSHLLLCWSCAQRVKKCLLCREPVERKEKVEECLVCSEKVSNLIFMPCGHIVTCEECGRRVKKCLTCKETVIDKKVTIRPGNSSGPGKMGNSLSDSQSKHLLKEVEMLKDQLQCSICCDRKKNCVLNCGHTFCQMCADQMRTCPMCNKSIEKRLIMYNS
jgi:E3 ubiquitin-protein ligase mind-bomb